MFYNKITTLERAFEYLEGTRMNANDYKEIIIKMIEDMDDLKILKRIYIFIKSIKD